MRSETAREIMKRVVGWVLSLELHRAAMVKIFPSVPMMQNKMANIAPIIEVVSLNNNSVASPDSGLPILSVELIFIKQHSSLLAVCLSTQ